MAKEIQAKKIQAKKIFNDYNRRWHKRALNEILKSLEDGKEQYTHFFYHVVHNGLQDYEMRQALRTLEFDGLIENINLGLNIHKWKITEKGLDKLKQDNERT